MRQATLLTLSVISLVTMSAVLAFQHQRQRRLEELIAYQGSSISLVRVLLKNDKTSEAVQECWETLNETFVFCEAESLSSDGIAHFLSAQKHTVAASPMDATSKDRVIRYINRTEDNYARSRQRLW